MLLFVADLPSAVFWPRAEKLYFSSVVAAEDDGARAKENLSRRPGGINQPIL
jgi:hypothetical protein